MAQGVVTRRWRAKRQGFALDVRTVKTTGDREDTILLIRDSAGSFHALVEIDAKQAAQRCGAPKNLTTAEAWTWLLRAQENDGS